MTEILMAVVCLGLIGMILAVILYVTSKKFVVYTDPRIADITEALPKVNCGGCGYPGCSSFAEACVEAGKLDGKNCPVGGTSVMEKIAGILGIGLSESEPRTAVVRCQGTCTVCLPQTHYDGIQSCASMSLLYGGETNCSWGCLGCGDCVRACTFDALRINPDTRLPEVQEPCCTACGMCVKACPRHIIELRPKGKLSRRIYVACVNNDKGAVSRKACTVSCIGCGKCLKTCSFDAITMAHNRAYIDPQQCRLCRKCVEVCPQHAIVALNFPLRKKSTETAELKET